MGIGRESGLRLAGWVAAALVGLISAAHAEIVANFGTLSQIQSGQMSCGTQTNSCTGTPVTGSYGGQLPGIGGTFTHQILFTVAADSGTTALTSILDSTDFDTANLTVALYQASGGSPTTVGATATHGAALANAVSATFLGSTFYNISYSALQPGVTYIIEIIGAGSGVQSADANYSQLVNISAVPLPPAVFLLAAALAGLIGFARFRRRRQA